MDNIMEYASNGNIKVMAVKLNDSIKFDTSSADEIFTDFDGIIKLTEYLGNEFSARNRAVPEWDLNNNGMTRDQFMAEKFGRIFILIDDMAKFCELLYGSGDKKDTSGLMEMFFKRGKDHGIHIFGGYNNSRKTYLSASNIFRSENYGVHLGGKANEQGVLEINMPYHQLLKPLAPNIGYIAEGKKAVMIYMPERK
jgi:hypothetical protein